MRVILPTVLLIAAIANAESHISLEEAEEFFELYQEMGKNFDPEIADLYSDEANISTLRTYPWGTKKLREMDGKQYKVIIKSVLPLAKDKGDISTFTDIEITVEKSVAKISAKRFSETKQYMDEGYYMVLEKSSEGEISIIEEHTNTKP